MDGYAVRDGWKTRMANVLGMDWKQGKAWSLLAGRLALGFVFLWGGYTKVLTWMAGGMATKGFLSGPSVAGSPFADFFNGLAGNWTVEYIVVGGELMIGLALIFGTFTRLASISGILQMTLFTIAMWPIQDRPTDNPIVDIRVFYAVVFLMMVFLTPGRFLGGDAILRNLKFVQNRPRLAKILSWLG